MCLALILINESKLARSGPIRADQIPEINGTPASEWETLMSDATVEVALRMFGPVVQGKHWMTLSEDWMDLKWARWAKGEFSHY